MKDRLSRIPDFFRASWYSDRKDHRCPQDSFLDSIQVDDEESGETNETSGDVITVRLRKAEGVAQIAFTYSGVRHRELTCYQCDQGIGYWLRDEFTIGASGILRHRITWQSPLNGTSQWIIEAQNVMMNWTTK